MVMDFDQWYTLQEEKHGTPPFACSYDAAKFAWQSSIQENALQALSDMTHESVVKDSLTPEPLISETAIKETGVNLEQDHCERPLEMVDKLAEEVDYWKEEARRYSENAEYWRLLANRVADGGKGIADHIGDANEMVKPAEPDLDAKSRQSKQWLDAMITVEPADRAPPRKPAIPDEIAHYAAQPDAPAADPVAYVLFSDNGRNIRLWSRFSDEVHKVADKEGRKVVPLYAQQAPALRELSAQDLLDAWHSVGADIAGLEFAKFVDAVKIAAVRSA